MKVHRGDIVLVDYPFSDRTGSKVRPCLVVQSNHNNKRLDDTIVVIITSRTERVHTEPTQLLIDVSTAFGKQTGLLTTSAIQCENILTIDANFILRKMGSLPSNILAKIDDCLKAALDLS